VSSIKYLKNFYTYLYLREDGTPYYVGKGIGQRAYEKRGHYALPPKDHKRIIVQEHFSEQDALDAEIFLISYYGRKDLRTGPLRNFTDGGQGMSGRKHTDETKYKMHLIGLGRFHTEESKKKISSNRRTTHCARGHELTENNCYWQKDGRRRCRTCKHIGYLNRRAQ
jgi:hypothetical protein